MNQFIHKPFFVLGIGLFFFISQTRCFGQDDIVDRVIAVYGTAKLKSAQASFDFRDHAYQYKRDNGQFTYTRMGKNRDGSPVRDIYSNDGLVRYVGDTLVSLTEKRRKAYANSVNSVIYFAFLPLWLKDPAVILQDKGTSKIKGREYHKIKVTFGQEDGGDDFEDIFYYWFDVKDLSMDYLAYKYKTGKGGMRFREAYNIRKVNGVTIQDYHNFRPKLKGSVPFDLIEKAFENGQLEELSIIELKNVKIKAIPKT
ncbi:hypothetical protein MTsPCn9_22080 [Croceitalea sp. MTPC9]|uniref:DUF6503 family protein n=1 Tax=Croceitalea marina TaxID=1775166 RepID=A0ABW5MSI8_9FLAO|nr:hypothetical protein MTsPCn6_24180 [Croceitalea sp. MTPC6]GMN17272.1 hypothetical protein MTsPCn9_22080 [Croceitalea sp. MTPC9]